MNLDKVKIKYQGGGCFIDLKPKFSSNEENVFIVKRTSILQYSTKTGKLITEYQGLEKSIVGFDVADINDCENLLVISEDGEFRAWKTATRFKSISKKIELSAKINSFHYVPNGDKDKLEGIITYTSAGHTSVSLVDIHKESLKHFKVTLKGESIFVSVSDKRFFAVADKKTVQFIRVDKPEKSKQFYIAPKQYGHVCITCLECHNQEEIVLSGDSEGKVTLWQNIFGNNPAKSVYHWHTLPVNCLSFSSSSSYFYSGGNESVFVKWDWHNSQKKQFLPRLPGYIKKIGVSPKNQLLAIYTSNNEVKIVDSNLNNVSSIQHFIVGDNYESGIVLDPRTKALVMNANVGHLQFYDPKTDSLLYNMDIVMQNKRSMERNTEIPNVNVTKFAFSKNSLWFATVEDLIGSEYKEMRLKFWIFDTSCQKYKLNTSLEMPHKKSITSLEFQDISEEKNVKCITVSKNKNFKIWHKIDTDQGNTIWNLLKVGTYKDMPCKGLSFSMDSSLFAIGFGPILTLWSAESCEIKSSINNPKYKTDIENVQFGSINLCHLIVVTTKDRLEVWNILTLKMTYSVPLEVDFLLAHKLSAYMGVITKKKQVIIFTPGSSKPVYVGNDICSKEITAAALVPSELWSQKVEIFWIDSNGEIFAIGEESTEEYSVDKYIDDNPDQQITSLFSKMMPLNKIKNSPNGPGLQFLQKSQKNIKEYLETPIVTAVAPRYSCLSLLKSLECKKL